MPIMYVEVPHSDGLEQDDLWRMIRSRQWVDWTEIRLHPPKSARYRKAVTELAKQLMDANARRDRAAELESEATVPVGAVEIEPPGFIDQIAAGEEAIPGWLASIHSMSEQLVEINAAMDRSMREVVQLNHEHRGIQGRLIVAKRLAAILKPLVDRITQDAEAFLSGMYGFDALVQAVATAQVSQANSDDRRQLCDLSSTLSSLCDAADDTMVSVKPLIGHAQQMESLSRDLRPVMRTLRQGLLRLVESQAFISEWRAVSVTLKQYCTNGASSGDP